MYRWCSGRGADRSQRWMIKGKFFFPRNRSSRPSFHPRLLIRFQDLTSKLEKLAGARGAQNKKRKRNPVDRMSGKLRSREIAPPRRKNARAQVERDGKRGNEMTRAHFDLLWAHRRAELWASRLSQPSLSVLPPPSSFYYPNATLRPSAL